MARRTLVLALIVSLAAVALVGWFATRREIASGSGKKGEWRVEASWFGGYCLKRYHGSGEGGACGFAQPGTVDESVSWKLFSGNKAITLVAGPVPPDTEQVMITPQDEDPVMADLTKVVGMTFFAAEVPGVRAVEIAAMNAGGGVIESLRYGPLPPPVN